MRRLSAIARVKSLRVIPLALFALLGLVACESLPQVPEDSSGLSLRGRLQVTLSEDVNSANFRWTQTNSGFDAYFWGAMGAGTRHLFGNKERLTLESREGKFSGPPEEILERHLGWSLPVELLLSWVRGVPSADMPVERPVRSDDGRLESFRQAGWQLRFDDFDGLGRYTRLTAEGNDVRVLLIVKQRSGT